MSDSFSNILPIKQLIEDDWKQAPADESSIGFTQNEVGLKTYWHSISLNLAHRLDYFVFTNTDTAKAFYLERTDQPLTSQDSYQLSLKLHHQRSNGLRLGYQWQFEHFSTEFNLGYWDISASRESQITGEIFGDEHNNITGTAELTEFYSDKNFLKRDNFNRWDIDGYGLTLDVSANWQVNDKLDIKLDIKDLYSQFKMKNLGYSQGKVDTDGTFINSLGGQSYLPLYRGIESASDYQFELPERINLIARYQGNTYKDKSLTMHYLARYKRQGEVDFYYAGLELELDNSTVKIMLDLEHLSPEVQYGNKWLNIILAIDEFNVDKAMQLTLGVAINYNF
ncbi:MAG: hypothetical protein OQK09_11830 [Colwellia sp.]|nr:hypothetical protein [Colwellia sp.]MCW8863936.1 hypothetical protein [Colwellia sp.]MCW9082192.1 hypothetical protein [Colwellia sp.]